VCVCERERGGGRKETDRQTDRQTDREEREEREESARARVRTHRERAGGAERAPVAGVTKSHRKRERERKAAEVSRGEQRPHTLVAGSSRPHTLVVCGSESG
jgi:hypothetical protein